MITLLSFMEKIYSDTKTLSLIYIIGSILLFIFIILLIFSLRKPDKKTANIIDEPNIDNNDTKEEIIQEIKEIPVQEDKKKLEDILNVTDKKEEPTNKETPVQILEKQEEMEAKEEKVSNVSAEIPSIDDYVDNIVNKTYEKNEQFSSVYVNTSTIKLEKVLDELNVDDDIKEEIVPEEEKVQKEVTEEINEDIVKEPLEVEINENNLSALKTALEEKKQEENNNLDKLESLKKTLEEKRNSVSDKQDELKNKLALLKNNNSNKLDDLKNKLDNLKNQ